MQIAKLCSKRVEQVWKKDTLNHNFIRILRCFFGTSCLWIEF